MSVVALILLANGLVFLISSISDLRKEKREKPGVRLGREEEEQELIE